MIQVREKETAIDELSIFNLITNNGIEIYSYNIKSLKVDWSKKSPAIKKLKIIILTIIT